MSLPNVETAPATPLTSATSQTTSAPKIYTRTGDKGDTHLIGGRTSKATGQIETIGTIDELNAALGLARSADGTEKGSALIAQIQSTLFSLGSELARGEKAEQVQLRVIETVGDGDIEQMEKEIDFLTADLPELRNFILPGGTERAARIHVARAVCRRAERRLVAIKGSIRPEILRYVNRLADLLFTMARFENHAAGAAEHIWKSGASGSDSHA